MPIVRRGAFEHRGRFFAWPGESQCGAALARRVARALADVLRQGDLVVAPTMRGCLCVAPTAGRVRCPAHGRVGRCTRLPSGCAPTVGAAKDGSSARRGPESRAHGRVGTALSVGVGPVVVTTGPRAVCPSAARHVTFVSRTAEDPCSVATSSATFSTGHRKTSCVARSATGPGMGEGPRSRA